jgi:hypothetical protein
VKVGEIVEKIQRRAFGLGDFKEPHTKLCMTLGCLLIIQSESFMQEQKCGSSMNGGVVTSSQSRRFAGRSVGNRDQNSETTQTQEWHFRLTEEEAGSLADLPSVTD